MTKWARTDVDALNMMDDWGAQRDLLISPQLWDEFFMPMYGITFRSLIPTGKRFSCIRTDISCASFPTH